MSKFMDFYSKVTADEESFKEFKEIVLKYNAPGTALENVTEETLEALEPLAKKMGFEISAAEAKEYLGGEAEMSEDDLDNVAGGKGSYVSCSNGAGNVDIL